ncbi:hypothetical protein [Rhizobium leguminosarum]|uniref:hypothetical protein n=1 Tax=Rhizobium leguminosarum TaxID=384 RepID=UPI001C976673|nr:hypothetical protein [Rhizobium leguminosarum]MBY5401045.1 hypothetical protein [Rhizobium leguminosarum]
MNKRIGKIAGKLVASADAAIGQSLSNGAPGSVKAPRTEPGLVAAVVVEAVPAMARAWRSHLQPLGLAVEISAVFTHQSPKVRFTSSANVTGICELADMLVVIDDLRTKIRTAALVQAKMAAQRGWVKIGGYQNKLQLNLFQNWPPFDFEEKVYNLQQVDFQKSGGAAGSGVYGIIDRHWLTAPRVPNWKQLDPSVVPGATAAAPTLGEFIVLMLGNKAGRDATLGQYPSDWARTVEALLKVTFHNQFHERRSMGASAFPRGNTTMAFLMSGQLLQHVVISNGMLPVDVQPEIVNVEEPPLVKAISTLLVTLSDNGLSHEFADGVGRVSP